MAAILQRVSSHQSMAKRSLSSIASAGESGPYMSAAVGSWSAAVVLLLSAIWLFLSALELMGWRRQRHRTAQVELIKKDRRVRSFFQLAGGDLSDCATRRDSSREAALRAAAQ